MVLVFLGALLSAAVVAQAPDSRMAAETERRGTRGGTRDGLQLLLDRLNFTIEKGEVEGAPIIGECPVVLECKLIQTITLPTHQVHVGEVIQTHADKSCLVDGKPAMSKVDPLVFSISEAQYYSVGEEVAKAFKVGRELN